MDQRVTINILNGRLVIPTKKMIRFVLDRWKIYKLEPALKFATMAGFFVSIANQIKVAFPLILYALFVAPVRKSFYYVPGWTS